MATSTEKDAFISSIYKLIQACNTKANDGKLTDDQRAPFFTASLFFNSRLGSALLRDFSPIPSDLVLTAINEISQAASATSAAANDSTVQIATKELWDAATAINNALGIGT